MGGERDVHAGYRLAPSSAINKLVHPKLLEEKVGYSLQDDPPK